MANFLLNLLSLIQTLYSAYNLSLLRISVSNLKGYEGISEKAAKHSNVAADQLYKTRTTQGVAVVSVSVSLLTSSLQLLFLRNKWINIVLALINAAMLEAARRHVGAFWTGKKRVPLPGTGDYNEAMGKTQEVKLGMAYLVASWGTVAFLGLFV